MRREPVLVTGGAGFIGSHLVDRLLAAGREVRVLDSIESQVHGDSGGFRNPDAEYIEGSVMNRQVLRRALADVGSVVHLAAQVGVGQSMYDMTRYVSDNCVGTAMLLEELVRSHDDIQALVVASSMSIYGEGLYACDSCETQDTSVVRTLQSLKSHAWDPVCAVCAAPARPLPTPETKRLESDSVYAVTKRDQEELALVFGRAYGVRTVALRFFNVYGPRQSLSNPYTGVAAIFLSRLLNRASPLVFEDGRQSRDFIHVSDIVQGIERSLDASDVDGVALNIGTGQQTTVLDIVHILAQQLGLDIEPSIVNEFRHGDIRHCYADIGEARRLLDYEPRVSLETGMAELIEWTRRDAPEARDLVEQAEGELRERGLVV